NDKLNLAYEQMTSLKEENRKYQIKVDQQTTEITSLNTKLTQQYQLTGDLLSQLTDKSKELEHKQHELERNQQLSEEEKNQLKREIDILTKGIEKLTSSLQQEITKYNDLKEEFRRINEKFDFLERKINNDKQLEIEKKEYLNNEIGRYKREITELKSNNEELEQDRKIFSEAVVSFREALNTLKEVKIESKARIEKENNNLAANKYFRDSKDFPTFEDVIGKKKEKQQLKDILDRLINHELYEQHGIKKKPKGVLLYGPPGTGKTFLAKAFIKESNLPCFIVSSADFSKKYVGEAPQLIRNIFEAARERSPSIILIDECESVFKNRNMYGMHSDHGNVVTEFLSQIEGIYTDKKKPVFVIATTNFKDEIDNSILSRFNNLIEVNFWNGDDLKIFFKEIAKNYKIDLRTEKYFDEIIKKIMITSDEYGLRTPRKIIELFEQATLISLNYEKHNHLRILPIDLQLAFDRITEASILVDWTQHEHQKLQQEELFSIKEFKKIIIRHLFKDSYVQSREESNYFSLIYDKAILLDTNNKKLFYNQNNNKVISTIEINEDNLNKIKSFYSDEKDPFPQKLLGFYFEYDNNYENEQFLLKINKITTLEDIFDQIIKLKLKIKKIYFIWDINKIEENKKIFFHLKEKLIKKYFFLENDLDFNQKLLEACKQEENNKEELEEIIIQYLNNIKQNISYDVYHRFVLLKNNIYNEENKIDDDVLLEQVKKLTNYFFQKNEILDSIETIKNKILRDIKEQHQQKNKLKILQIINNFLERINFNKHFISDENDEEIKKKTKQEIFEKLEFFLENNQNMNIRKNEIKIKINEKIDQLTENIFLDYWENSIVNKLELDNLNTLEKENIFIKIKKKIKQNLIYNDNSLEKILENAQNDISNYINNFNSALEKKINNYFYFYFLEEKIDPILIDNNQIDFLKKQVFIFLKNELKNNKIKEEEIKNQTYLFLKKYDLKNKNIKKDLYFYVKKYPFFILIIIFLIFSNIKNFFNFKK
ncbi:AAA family ATPase, partial [Candidatus Phytoplasma oryzae]